MCFGYASVCVVICLRFRSCSQPCLESDLKCPTTLVCKHSQSPYKYMYIFMYCYAYTVHSASCFNGRQELTTSSLAQSPMAIPVLFSVADCATFYSDCLTTRQRCGLRLRKMIVMAGGVGMQWRGFCGLSFGAPQPLQRLGLQAQVQLRM